MDWLVPNDGTIQGFQRRDFWSTKVVDMFIKSPYRFNDIMSRNHFEKILAALRFNNQLSLIYKDAFHEVHQMVDCWNDNMYNIFSPGWITCLDKSVMKWINQFTYSGFMFIPRKPWLFENEFHTITSGVLDILFSLELVEGKDCPSQKSAEDYRVKKGSILCSTH